MKYNTEEDDLDNFDYSKDLLIDGQALDQEWLNQSSLMFKYSKHASIMTKRLDEAKQNLDIAKSEADKRIRKNPEKYEIEKVTEVVVANTILTEEGYKDAYDEYLSAKYEADMAKSAVVAFEQRKSSLEYLVKLYIAQYFSGPIVPYNIDREWVEKEKSTKISSKINEGLKMAHERRTRRNE